MMRATCFLALVLAACGSADYCDEMYTSCEVDEDCQPGPLPPGKCLDDRSVGRICALYFYSCPTKLRWSECAGMNGIRSPWAGRCVRPEFLPDGGSDDGGALVDQSASVEAGGGGNDDGAG